MISAGDSSYDALVASAAHLVIGLDFDGTLAPIVDDPTQAHIHPDAPDLLVRLADLVGAVAVVTGRPARQVLALGGLDEVGDEIGSHGRRLHVWGQYGHERWTSVERRVLSPQPPRGLATVMGELQRVLARHDAADAFVEEKGLAVAVHTRRCADPAAAFDRLLPVLTEVAHDHGLEVEPGRLVIEIRAASMDKGRAVERLVEEVGGRGLLFAGDDLGDVEAFRAGLRMREAGLPVLLVCSGSGEQQALAEMADLVVDGPDGVIALLGRLADDIEAARR